MFTLAWFKNALNLVVVAFVGGFVGVVISAGQTNLLTASTLHAAAVAGIMAAAVALQSLLAAVTSPPASATPFWHVAVGQRVVYAARSTIKTPELPPALTTADIIAAVREGVREGIAQAYPPSPPPAT